MADQLRQLREAARTLRELLADWQRGDSIAPEGRDPVELALSTMTMYWQDAKDVAWQVGDKEWLDAKRAHDVLLRTAGDVGPLCRFGGTADIPRILKDLDHAGRLLGFLDPEPIVAKAEPTPAADNGAIDANEVSRLLHLAGDGTGVHVLAIARDDTKSADDRLYEIIEIDKRYEGFNSPKLAELLDVTDAAIRKTGFWRGRKARREGL